MTFRLVQHIPNYCEGFEPKIAEADTQAELLAVPWVAVYAHDVESVEREGTVSELVDGHWHEVRVIHSAPAAQVFFRFSLSDEHLMVEHNEGRRWWVVGTVTHGREHLTLPKWAPHRDGLEKKGTPMTYRCAEHGVLDATCCLHTRRPS